jgi:cytochrome c-type biogenesis protein
VTLLFLSFIAGILTVTAPCVLIFLPVILGGSVLDKKDWRRPLVVTGSLVVSVVVFTLLLRATTALLGVPQMVWQILSGVVVILLGLHYLGLPIWERFTAILTGAALGPVFASCSPTFAFIVAAIIPADFILGLIYLVVYAIGMATTLLAIAYLGRSVISKLGAVNNPHGWLARSVGIIFIVVGLMVAVGLDKTVQTFVIEQGWYDPITKLEQGLM